MANHFGNIACSVFKSLDLDESEEEVKGSPGAVFFVHAVNTNAAARYLKLYDGTAATVVVGTAVPVATFALPISSTPFTFQIERGINFATAITAAVTTGIADNDTGAPGASEVSVNIGYI
jgi:hypothetical protein